MVFNQLQIYIWIIFYQTYSNIENLSRSLNWWNLNPRAASIMAMILLKRQQACAISMQDFPCNGSPPPACQTECSPTRGWIQASNHSWRVYRRNVFYTKIKIGIHAGINLMLEFHLRSGSPWSIKIYVWKKETKNLYFKLIEKHFNLVIPISFACTLYNHEEKFSF